MAEYDSIVWIYLYPSFKDPLVSGAITECFTYQHTRVHPHPQPGLGDSHSGTTLHCWCNAHSCRFLGSGTHQYLPKRKHKPGHYWVNLTFLQSSPVATTLHYQHFVFNFIICGRTHRCDNKSYTQMQFFQTYFSERLSESCLILPLRRVSQIHFSLFIWQFSLILKIFNSN